MFYAGAHRCSTCNLNYPSSRACDVCGEKTAYMSNATVTENLEEQIARMKRVDGPLIPEEEKVKDWRQLMLLQAGYPWDYAVRIAKDREIDLHKACIIMQRAVKKHGPEKGLELTLEILL